MELPSDLSGNALPEGDKPSIRMVNVRSCIRLLLEQLKPRNVWMPSYLCGAMLQSLRNISSQLRFIPVDANLRVEADEWIAEVEVGDVVVLIDYFGFAIEQGIASIVRARGAWILEDACQALLSDHVGRYSDFVVVSPRKFIGIPDGGILYSVTNCGLLPMPMLSPPDGWWLKSLLAGISRREFDIFGGDRNWYHLFQQVESEQPVGNYRMSELSEAILQHCLDKTDLSARRRSNYRLLLDELSEFALYKDMPEDVTPAGFPIVTACRDVLRKTLFAYNIYPPIHWVIEGIVPAHFVQSHKLASGIMTLPCDHRYNAEDMHYIAKCVKRHIAVESSQRG